ncbi:MAG: hypothetical protein ABEK59_02880 [Halobacteria archaeon]
MSWPRNRNRCPRELKRRARFDVHSWFVLGSGAENEGGGAREFHESLGFDFLGEASVEFGGSELELALYRKDYSGYF